MDPGVCVKLTRELLVSRSLASSLQVTIVRFASDEPLNTTRTVSNELPSVSTTRCLFDEFSRYQTVCPTMMFGQAFSGSAI